jgi:Asp-tRNA(Asn)/Glu-tRNA(Gln) amidotransferase A subunit family amidase
MKSRPGPFARGVNDLALFMTLFRSFTRRDRSAREKSPPFSNFEHALQGVAYLDLFQIAHVISNQFL